MKKLDKTFKINPLYETDGYKVGHPLMLAPNTKIFAESKKYSQVEEVFDEQTNSWKPIKYF